MGSEHFGKNNLHSPEESCSGQPREKVYLKDIAQIIAPDAQHPKLNKLMIHQVSDQDKNIIIIDVMKVIAEITKLDSTIRSTNFLDLHKRLLR